MLTTKFGIEIEMTGITREIAAQVTAETLHGTYSEGGTQYDIKNVPAPDGRVWKIMSDGSISCQKKDRDRIGLADPSYSVELVSPIPDLCIVL